MVLQGKVALVTGAGRGMGRAIAIQLAKDGADVAVADINREAVEQTSIAIRELGQESVAIQANMGSVNEIDLMIHDTVETLGSLDILVNNAGITKHIQFMSITEEDWDSIHRINARGVFFCTQRAARQMAKQGNGGRIINIASIAGKGYAKTSNAAYAASKGAVIGLTYIAAHQLSEYNINVNAICPGITRTEMLEGIMAGRAKETGLSMDEIEKQMAQGTPTGRVSETEDIAAMAAFLAGPGSRNITGQTFNVDGGLIMQ